MKAVSWQVVALVGMGLGAFLGLYALVPPSESEARAGLIALVSTLGSAGAALIIARRQDQTEKKIDQVVEQTNGHHAEDSTP
jgi:hypothetical protein